MDYPMKSTKLLLTRACGTGVSETACIIHIESSSNYSRVYFTNRAPLLVCKTLLWFEEKLPCISPGKVPLPQDPNPAFVRVHRSHLVNRAFIAAWHTENYLLLQNGQLVPVSRRRKKVVG